MGEERFLGYIESYGELYASFSCKYNYWCMFDKSGKIVSNGTIEQYSHNAYDLYTLHRVNGYIIGMPYYGNDILIWEKRDSTVSRIKLTNLPEMDSVRRAKFSSFAFFENNIYMFPFQSDFILVFDVESRTIIRSIDLKLMIKEKLGFPYEYGLTYGGYSYGSKLYSCLYEKGVVIEMGAVDNSISFFCISEKNYEIAYVTGYSHYLYLITYDRRLFVYDILTHRATQIMQFGKNILPEFERDGGVLVVCYSKIYIIPNFAEEMIVLNLKSKTYSKAFDISVVEKALGYACNKVHFYYGYAKKNEICFYTDLNDVFFYKCDRDALSRLVIKIDGSQIKNEIVNKAKNDFFLTENNIYGLKQFLLFRLGAVIF